MKKLFLFAMFMVSTQGFAGEVQDLNVFQRQFWVPVNTTKVTVLSTKLKDVKTQVEIIVPPGCEDNGESSAFHCTQYKYKKEKLAQVTLAVNGFPYTNTNGDMYTSEDVITTNFRPSEFTGQQAVETRLETRDVEVGVVDEKASIYCPRDGEGNVIYPDCQDQLVYKTVIEKRKFLSISAK